MCKAVGLSVLSLLSRLLNHQGGAGRRAGAELSVLSLLSRLLNLIFSVPRDCSLVLSVLSLLSRLLNRPPPTPARRARGPFSALSVEPSAESPHAAPGSCYQCSFSALSVEPSAESRGRLCSTGGSVCAFSALSVEPSAESLLRCECWNCDRFLSVLSLLSRLLNHGDDVSEYDKVVHFQCSLC